MSLQVDATTDAEEKQIKYELRKSLVEAFLGIINGIKSPADNDNNSVISPNLIKHIQDIFYFIEGLISVE